MPAVRPLIDAYYRFLKVVLTALMFLLTAPVLLQVLARYVDVVPRYIWTEEMARFAFIWIVMIGSSIAVREGTHFQIDFLPRLSPRAERALDLAYLVLMLVAAAVFVAGGFRFAQFGLSQESELAALPMVTIFAAWPLAGLSWAVFLIEQLYRFFEAGNGEARHGTG